MGLSCVFCERPTIKQHRERHRTDNYIRVEENEAEITGDGDDLSNKNTVLSQG